MHGGNIAAKNFFGLNNLFVSLNQYRPPPPQKKKGGGNTWKFSHKNWFSTEIITSHFSLHIVLDRISTLYCRIDVHNYHSRNFRFGGNILTPPLYQYFFCLQEASWNAEPPLCSLKLTVKPSLMCYKSNVALPFWRLCVQRHACWFPSDPAIGIRGWRVRPILPGHPPGQAQSISLKPKW